MTPLKIGNWLITNDGIKWDANDGGNVTLERESITELGSAERGNMYDWLIHVPEKTWMTHADTYALNAAFIYSIGAFNLNFDADCFTETLIEQKRILAEKE
jgi:hypothetical protein